MHRAGTIFQLNNASNDPEHPYRACYGDNESCVQELGSFCCTWVSSSQAVQMGVQSRDVDEVEQPLMEDELKLTRR